MTSTPIALDGLPMASLTQLLADQYGCANPRENQTFEELGLDSLDRVEIGYLLEEQFGVSLPHDHFRERNTLQQVCEKIDELRREKRRPPVFTLTIPEHAWRRSGDPKEDGRLFAHLVINGVPFHLEAIPMTTPVEVGFGVGTVIDGANDMAEQMVSELDSALAGSGPFQLMDIAGDPYLVIAHPHRQ